jgi:dihydrodipicolinate synthase/N-acetylneuraminate lyase
MNTPMRGIFPVLQTALDANDELDFASLKKQVSFCIEAGAHGLVYPVLGSAFQFLADHERHPLVEAVIEEAAGRIPVVVGVAGRSIPDAEVHARHAAQAGADAIIALPPYIAAGSSDHMRAYYTAIAKTAQCPVFIQHTTGDLTTELMRQLFEEVEHITYLKEEMPPSAHQISAVVKTAGPSCLGVFGGAFGRWMLSELHRGATGFMPAAESIDVHVQVWDAYQAGNQAEARRIFNALLPLINFTTMIGLHACKEVLVRRGIFKSSAMRLPNATIMDDADQYELDRILEDLQPFFKI